MPSNLSTGGRGREFTPRERHAEERELQTETGPGQVQASPQTGQS